MLLSLFALIVSAGTVSAQVVLCAWDDQVLASADS
jgi:hypothetical protein